MNVNLLFPNKEWVSPSYYFDEKNITEDLGLDALFLLSSKRVIYRLGEVEKVDASDAFIQSTMKKVMLTPLYNKEDIYFRQEIIKDAIKNQQLFINLYEVSKKMLDSWDKLGRRLNGKTSGKDNVSKLITSIHEFRLFLDSLTKVKKLLSTEKESLRSEGMVNFYEALCKSFSDSLEEDLHRLSDSVAFYIPKEKVYDDNPTMEKPRIKLSCKVGEGGKLSDFELLDIDTVIRKYRDKKSLVGKVQGYINSFTPDSVATDMDINTERQASYIQYQVVNYMLSFVEPFMSEYEYFFDRLHFALAFYVGTINLHHHFLRFKINYGYPEVVSKDELSFDELKEIVMVVEQKVDAVYNTMSIKDKSLIIITGANQGGKSTFLRSVGIAQVMMQCGLMVPARHYKSGLFPSLFMHFTRREDSEMNSGRLDEELNRMNEIVKHLGPDSLILLNESFATTTELDGSAIAYDIIRALNESGVKIITVTHLLSFAQKMHRENEERLKKGEASHVEFLCAERLKSGKRTYKMIQSVPELTSFGLDLYERIIENNEED